MFDVVISIISWFVRWCVKGIKTPIQIAKDSQAKAIDRIGAGCCLLGMGITFVRGLVLWIMFIVDTGYGDTFALFKAGKFGEISVQGNMEGMYDSVFFIITLVLLSVGLLITLYCFYRSSKLIGKVLFTLTIILVTILSIVLANRVITDRDVEGIVGLAVLGLSILSIWLLQHYGTGLGTSFIFSVAYGVVIGPLLLCAVENIFGLLVCIIMLLVAGFIISILGDSNGSQSGGQTAAVPNKAPSKVDKSDVVKKKNESNARRIDLIYAPYLGEDILGDKNTIFVKESFTGTEHGQCSKGDFESGNCQLYYQGKRVMDIYGCKRPKK